MRAGERVGELQRLLGMTREEAEESVREEAVLDAVADERARIRRLALAEADRIGAPPPFSAKISSECLEVASGALRSFAALLEARP